MPNQDLGHLLRAKGISGLSHVRTKLWQMCVLALIPPHPVQPYRQSPRHGDFRYRSFASHRQVQIPSPPVGITAHRRLCGDRQKKTQQRIPLFGNVSELSPFSTGIFARHQPEIAAQLAAPGEAIRGAEDQNES